MSDTARSRALANAVTVVGIGADGWAGLAEPARAAIRAASVLIGGRRQLGLVPQDVGGERVAWPSPMLPALPGLFEAHRGREICVLASGDPMFFGVGSTLVRLLGADRLNVLPHPSSVSLACARLGWPVEDVPVVSLVGRPVDLLHREVQPERRLLVLGADDRTAAAVAALLTSRGYGGSELMVLESLGGADERILRGTAGEWGERVAGALNAVAVHCHADVGAPLLPVVPGLPDGAFDHDGQLTKREIRAITLARLAPVPGQLLWDIGAGAGSVAIEWMRAHRSCRAVAVERDGTRAARIVANAAALGVPGLRVVHGAAPAALPALSSDVPDAIFIGGGVSAPGLLEACWAALAPGGRLVVNAVTLESERVVADAYARHGGDLTRIDITRAAPLGALTTWRPALPVTQWSLTVLECG
jgi:precorrin-6Y C5,15-methyltransferase (decarboxylating)